MDRHLDNDDIVAATERTATRLRAGGPAQRLALMPSPLDHVLASVGADGWVEIG